MAADPDLLGATLVAPERGTVEQRVGRNHRLALRPDTLAEASGWIESRRRRWDALFDAVGEYLEERAGET